MRLPLAYPHENRGASTAYDSRLVNCYIEAMNQQEVYVRKRPGLSTFATNTSGCAQGITNVDGNIYTVTGDVLTLGATTVVTGVSRYSTFSTAITTGGAWTYSSPNFIQTKLTNLGGSQERTDIKTYDSSGALLSTSSYTGINGDFTNGNACGYPVNGYAGMKVGGGNWGGSLTYFYWGQNGSYTTPPSPGTNPEVNAIVMPANTYLPANQSPYGAFPAINRLAYLNGFVFMYMAIKNGSVYQPLIAWYAAGALSASGTLMESSSTSNSSGQDWVSPSIAASENGDIYTYHAENSGWNQLLRRYTWSGSALTLQNTWDLTSLVIATSNAISFTVKSGIFCAGGKCIKLNSDNTATLLGEVTVAAGGAGIVLSYNGNPVLPIPGTQRYLVYDGLIQFSTTTGSGTQTLPTSGTNGVNGNGTCLPFDFNAGSSATSPRYLFLKSANKAFTYNLTTSTYAAVTDVDYPSSTVRGVVFLDGYFFVGMPSGRIYNSDSNDPTSWAATSYLTAQIEPDDLVAIAKYKNYLVGFGEWSTEFFYDAGNAAPGSPLSPLTSSALQIGCANGDSVIEAEGTVFWFARSKQGGRYVCMLNGLAHHTISTKAIEMRLQTATLDTVYPACVRFNGHVFVLWNLPADNMTLAYDLTDNAWHEWTSATGAGSVTVASLTRSSDLATATVTGGHSFSTGDLVKLSGATPSGYNITVPVTVTSSTAFTFPVSGSLTTPATGTITATKQMEGYFVGLLATNISGTDYLLHSSNGKLYQMLPGQYDDDGQPIIARARTARGDAGNYRGKQIAAATIIGDQVASPIYLRYSDDDFQTYSTPRRIDMSLRKKQARRLGRMRYRSWDLLHTGSTDLRLQAIDIDLGQNVA